MAMGLKNKITKLLDNTGDMALKRRARNIMENLELEDGLKILEVGCGDGYYLHLLSNLGFKLKLFGTDYDKSGLERARNNLGKGVDLKFGDLMKKMPYPSNSFDRIIMSEVAEHLPNDVRGLKEVFRLLKPNGALCLTVPCANYPLLWDPINWLLETFFNTHVKSGFFAGLWNQHIRLYKPEQIISVVKKAGLSVEIGKTLTWWCLPFNHYIVNLVARGLAHGVFSNNIKSSLSKYTKNPKRPLFLNIAFNFVNALDRLNDYWQPKSSGVAVFVKARKV